MHNYAHCIPTLSSLISVQHNLIIFENFFPACFLTHTIEKESPNFTFFTLIHHTVSFDWFLSGLMWSLNLEFCLLKLLIFYQKLLWNIRSRLNSSTFWVVEPVFKYVWSKSSFLCTKLQFWSNISKQAQKLKMWKS